MPRMILNPGLWVRADLVTPLLERLADHSICPVCDADLGETVPHEAGCELATLQDAISG